MTCDLACPLLSNKGNVREALPDMKQKDIAELLDEPACAHNKKSKSGCAKPKPGATAGGCAFDGAQIALLPIADVAHIVHGPIACAGSSWDNRGTRTSGARLFRIGMTTDLTEQDVLDRARVYIPPAKPVPGSHLPPAELPVPDPHLDPKLVLTVVRSPAPVPRRVEPGMADHEELERQKGDRQCLAEPARGHVRGTGTVRRGRPRVPE